MPDVPLENSKSDLGQAKRALRKRLSQRVPVPEQLRQSSHSDTSRSKKQPSRKHLPSPTPSQSQIDIRSSRQSIDGATLEPSEREEPVYRAIPCFTDQAEEPVSTNSRSDAVEKPSAFISEVPVIVSSVVASDRPFELGDMLTHRWAKENFGLLASFFIHLVMFLIFSSMVFQLGTGKAMIVLQLLSSPDVEQTDIAIGTSENEDDDMDSLLGNLDDDSEGFPGYDEVFGATPTSKGEGATGRNRGAGGQGDGKSAKFFGTRAKGHKFIYVLDSSGSMGNHNANPKTGITRFEVAKNELINSIESLRPHQEFYVLLFSNATRRMFDDESLSLKTIKATYENKKRFREWLSKTRAGGGTDPREGLSLALKAQPDAVFILSDGEFRDEKRDSQPKSDDIAKRYVDDGSATVINAIAFEDKKSRANMRRLADIGNGEFRFVLAEDFADRLLLASDIALRMRGMDILVGSKVKDWNSRNEIAKELINALGSDSMEVCRLANRYLNELSFNIFESRMNSTFEPIDAKQKWRLIDDWTEIWKQTDEQIARNGSVPVSIGANSSDHQKNIEFFAVIASGRGAKFLDTANSVNLSVISAVHQIALARSVIDHQQREGESTASKRLMTKILCVLNQHEPRELDQAKVSGYNNEQFINCLEKILRNRRVSARMMSRQLLSDDFSEKEKKLLKQTLEQRYPEYPPKK